MPKDQVQAAVGAAVDPTVGGSVTEAFQPAIEKAAAYDDLLTLLAGVAQEGEDPAATVARLAASHEALAGTLALSPKERFKLALKDVLEGTGEDPGEGLRLVLAQIAEWARGTFNIPHQAALALMKLAE